MMIPLPWILLTYYLTLDWFFCSFFSFDFLTFLASATCMLFILIIYASITTTAINIRACAVFYYIFILFHIFFPIILKLTFAFPCRSLTYLFFFFILIIILLNLQTFKINTHMNRRLHLLNTELRRWGRIFWRITGIRICGIIARVC